MAVVGATGYVGQELFRLLSRHPQVEIVAATSESYQGQTLGQVYPGLGDYAPQVLLGLEDERVMAAEVVFTALPHGAALEIAPRVLGRGKVLIDFGADFRLRDPASYETWYRHPHTERELLGQVVYGLPEVYRSEIAGARLIANPGCYPTSAILGIRPLLVRGLIDPDSLVIDAKSGVSGAGRGLSLGVHFCEVNENFKAYSIAGTHRHTPEIEQELSVAAGRNVAVTFTPHLVPMTRGILSTIYAKLVEPVDAARLNQLYREFYAGERFVQVAGPGQLPQTKEVQGTNNCRLGTAVDERTGRVVVVSVIDNLVKGAAGQAVQNLNLVCGFPEARGLEFPTLYP